MTKCILVSLITSSHSFYPTPFLDFRAAFYNIILLLLDLLTRFAFLLPFSVCTCSVPIYALDLCTSLKVKLLLFMFKISSIQSLYENSTWVFFKPNIYDNVVIKTHLWILPNFLTMLYSHLFLILSLSLLSFFPVTHQLQNSQTQILYQLREQLEYPKSLEIWNNYSAELCYSLWSRQMNIVCHDNSITELKIVGDMSLSTSEFNGFPISNQTLSASFSVDSFITTLSRLTNLRALSLISLGIWGPLPDKIHRLLSLEVLDLSSNFLHGTIPSRISTMVKLQVVRLDYNFFNGTVPDWFDSLSNLTVLSLKNNQLKGPIPPTIGKIKTLTDLILSRNQISGQLPDLRNLTSLHLLDLRQNRIDSGLPVMPQGLVTVYLNNNSFSGKIPEQFVELSQLQHLDLSFNVLQGKPLAALFSLPHISYLNLASNMLSGSLPKHLRCGSALTFVDISTNRLTGGIPFCLSLLSNKTVVKLGGNCLSADAQHQNHESYCHSEGTKSLSWGKCVGLLVAIIGGIVLVLVLVFLSIILVRRYLLRRTSEQHLLPKPVQDKPPTVFSPQLLANARFISQATKMGTEGVFKYRLFSIEELKEATSNFNQSTLIGEGSMGKLYKGRLENGTEVAVRSLTSFRRDSTRNLKLQLDLLSKLHHPHLVCLLGHCIEGNEQDTSSVRIFLIYEYVSGGTFRTHLSEISSEKVLEWSERLSVLIGIAKAVHFLHTGITPGFFNNNLRTNSILLNEHGIAKLSDYGLSTLEEEMKKIEEKGDNKSWKKTKLQDDVYNFGFILLETLVGPTAVERGATFLLNDMTSFGSLDSRRQVVDPTVLTTCSEESLLVVTSITNKCISPEVSTRPSFEDVLWNLQYAAQVQATADGDQRSDVASQP